jgi:anaerobic selenocysteine-containing dehydrogenase
MSFTRRQFIQMAAGGAGAVALGSGLTTQWWGMDRHRPYDPGTDGDRVVPTFCEICFWKCGVLAHVKDGRVTKLEITSTIGGKLRLVSPWETITTDGKVLNQDSQGLVALDTRQGQTLLFGEKVSGTVSRASK